VFVLAMIYGRKKKRGKPDMFVIVLVLSLGVCMSLAACGTGTPQPNQITATIVETPGEYTITATPDSGSGYQTQVPAAPTVTPVPCPTVAMILTPMLTNAEMFYKAVVNNSGSLPARFSIALVLAMGEQETGGLSVPYDNTVPGGAMQIRSESGHLHQDKYTSDQTGYDNNVSDAVSVINDGYNSITHMQGYFWDYLGTIYPEPHIVDVVRSVLYYNGGYDWLDNYRNPSLSSNEGYLGAVAGKLESKVLGDFSTSDAGIIDPLKSAQHMVDCAVDSNNPSYNCK
jgi:hypothetical protein